MDVASNGNHQDVSEEIERIRVLFEQNWEQPNVATIALILTEVSSQDRPDLLRELLYVEFEFAHRQSAVLTLEPYLSRFPEYASIVHEVADDVGHYNVFKNRNIAGYTLLDELGRGGMGVVYRAKSDLLNNFVAFKMVHQRLVSSPETLRRFSRELEMIGRLKHPNIVEAKHAGIAPDGSPFLVMELVDGTTLSQWGKQNASTTLEYVQPSNLVLPSVEGTLSKSGPSKSGIAARQQSAILRESESARIVQVCTIIRDVALGLQAIHEAGLVHRDIKPGNIMLLPDGGVKILDLGLAKLREHIAEHPLEFASQTQQGHVLGTPGYMAPEQMQSARQVDIRADIYSLGCTFFFLLYGCALTDKQPKELLVTLPKKLQTILDRMLAANPAARFQEPKEIVDALDSFLGTARKSSWSRMVVGGFIVMSLTVALLANIPSAPNPRPSPPSPDVPPIPDSGVIQIDNMIKQQRMFDNVQAAIELRYQGNGEQAVSELKTLAAELRSSPFEGSDNLLAEILSAQGDCLFFAGLASDSLPEKIVKRLMAWYEEAETLTDSDYARVKLHCKLKIADSIHSTTMDGGSRARKLKTVRSGFREDEDKNLFLCCWLAEAISAMDDGLLRNFIEQFELSTESELITREALDLRLFALERLIYRNMNTDRETLAKDLRALDSILLAPYPDANSCVYLNRYFDLAIRHCDPTDHGQLVKYLCRLRPLSIPQGASLVLIYFSPQSDVEGFAIYYPAERQESQRFELPFNRDDVKKAVKQGESLVLPPELVALIWRDIATGVPIVLSWDDTACWSLRRDAFSNEDWAFDQSITIEEILGQMK